MLIPIEIFYRENLKVKLLLIFCCAAAYSFKKMWSHLGSNQGPSDYESDALTG